MKVSPGMRIQHTIDGSEGVVLNWENDPDLIRASGYHFSLENYWCGECGSTTDGYVQVEFDNGCGREIVQVKFLRAL